MGTLDDIGEQCDWRCWLCDQSVDPSMSVNDDLGPSIDRCEALAKPVSKKRNVIVPERLAHRGCNTMKGAKSPVVAWPIEMILFDPAPIIQSAERLMAKGGREMVARCATRADAKAAAFWLEDRLTRLVPDISFTTKIEEGGGQFLLSLMAPRPHWA